jgi:hypothetical protein
MIGSIHGWGSRKEKNEFKMVLKLLFTNDLLYGTNLHKKNWIVQN